MKNNEINLSEAELIEIILRTAYTDEELRDYEYIFSPTNKQDMLTKDELMALRKVQYLN